MTKVGKRKEGQAKGRKGKNKDGRVKKKKKVKEKRKEWGKRMEREE